MEKYQSIAKSILDKLASRNVDMAHCSVRESEMREFNVDGNEFSLFRTLFNRIVAITVFVNQKKGSVSINRFDEESIDEAIDNCIAAAESASADTAWELASGNGTRRFSRGALTPDTEKLFFRTKELLEDIKNRHPKINVEQMIVKHVSSKGVYMSTTGNCYFSESGKYVAELMYSAHDGDKLTSFFGSDVTLDNLDTPFIDCAFIERDLTDIENQLDSAPTNGKFQGTVIFTPACLVSTVFGNVCGNFASDWSLLEGTSPWKDKLGERVADERISVSFKPSDKRIINGEIYTDEGFISEDFDFIKNGVLQSFRLSQYVANKTNNKRAKNTSFAIIIENGETPLDLMIKSIDKGIIVGRFSGGKPGANGEISGVAKNGFMIENGRITKALSETMISGNLADMLNNVVAISKETLVDGTVVAPYIAFDGITVSGK